MRRCLRVRWIAVFLLVSAAGCGLSERSAERQKAYSPPMQVRGLLALAERRDQAVDTLLEIVAQSPAEAPAVGERLEAFRWLGLLRRTDPVVTDVLVANLTAVGVPYVLQGEWDERETFYPAALALSRLRVGDPTTLLEAAFRANDPLRTHLTAWVLRGAFDVPESLVAEFDREFDMQFHTAATALRAEIISPSSEDGPPPELLRIWNSEEFQSSATGSQSAWVGSMSEVYSDLVRADSLVSDLLLAPKRERDEALLNDWVLWSARVVLSPTSTMRSADERLSLTQRPSGPASPWCRNSDGAWESIFPVVGFAAATGRVAMADLVLEHRDRQDSPLAVDLATWAVIERSGGGRTAAAILRARARSHKDDSDVARRLAAAADKAAAWKPRPAPPEEVLAELGLSARQFRALCAP